MATEKTYHRWSEDEDRKLLAYVRERAGEFNTIGKAGGVPRDVFWGKVPGKLDLDVTPKSCEMRYRTLTHDSEWANKRRTASGERLAKKERAELLKKRREAAQAVLDSMSDYKDEFAPGGDGEVREELTAMRKAMEEQTKMMGKLLEAWRKSAS